MNGVKDKIENKKSDLKCMKEKVNGLRDKMENYENGQGSAISW